MMSENASRGRQAVTVAACLAAVLASSTSPQAQEAQRNAQASPETGSPRGVTTLDRITLSWSDATENVYERPEAASYIDGEALEERNAGDINEALRSTAGTFTRQTSDQPGITPNIRGLQGNGRVNSTIDGVPQTFTNLVRSRRHIRQLRLCGSKPSCGCQRNARRRCRRRGHGCSRRCGGLPHHRPGRHPQAGPERRRAYDMARRHE